VAATATIARKPKPRSRPHEDVAEACVMIRFQSFHQGAVTTIRPWSQLTQILRHTKALGFTVPLALQSVGGELGGLGAGYKIWFANAWGSWPF
jgi:hypothetical protein